MYSIYLLTNSVNGKKYVGKTRFSPEERWRIHCRDRRGCPYVRKALDKYGASAFTVALLEETETFEKADELEKFWIKLYDSTNHALGYNLTEGGSGAPGYKHTLETKKKMSAVHKGRRFTQEHRNKLSVVARAQGRRFTPEAIRAGVEARKKMSPEARSIAAGLGRKLTPEHRAKISAGGKGKQLGRPKSEEHRAKLAAALRGRTLPSEVKEKIAAAGRGRVQSLETREKRSKTMTAIRKARFWTGGRKPKKQVAAGTDAVVAEESGQLTVLGPSEKY